MSYVRVHRNEKPSEYGSQILTVTRTLGASPITASATTRIQMPTTGKTLLFRRVTGTNATPAASAGGTVIARVNKVTGTNTRTDISEALDLEAIPALKSLSAKYLAGQNAGTLVVKPGDGVEVSVVSNAAIETQPVQLSFTLEFFVLD